MCRALALLLAALGCQVESDIAILEPARGSILPDNVRNILPPEGIMPAQIFAGRFQDAIRENPALRIPEHWPRQKIACGLSQGVPASLLIQSERPIAIAAVRFGDHALKRLLWISSQSNTTVNTVSRLEPSNTNTQPSATRARYAKIEFFEKLSMG
jgi:hypothetical protein